MFPDCQQTEDAFWNIFLNSIFCGEFLCVGYTWMVGGGLWMPDLQETHFLIIFSFPCLCMFRQSMFQVQVSTHHNLHCLWPQHSRLGRYPWPPQSSPTHGAHTLYSLRGYITSVQIPLVTDNSLTPRIVRLILRIVQLTGATQILKVFPVSQALSKGDKISYFQENGSRTLEPLSASL